MSAIFRIPAVLIAGVVFLSSCDEQQVLYTIPSDEPIPESPDRPTSMADALAGNVGPHGAPLPANRPPTGEELPPPAAAEFTARPVGDLKPVDLVGLRFPVPASFAKTPAAGGMRAAEFIVPAAADGEPGEFVAFHFGPGQGGDVMGNAGRWHSQFTTSDGSNPLILFEQQERGELTVSRIKLAGTYTTTRMPGMQSAPVPQEDWALDAAIIEGGPLGTLFLRLTGPRELVNFYDWAMETLAARASLLTDDANVTAKDDHSGHDHSDDEIAKALEGGSEALIHGYSMNVPRGWEPVEPSSRMRAAQYHIHGMTGGEAAIFYFGPEGGGSVDANLDRWAGQSDGEPVRYQLNLGELTIHRVDVTGTYSPSAMTMRGDPPPPKENYSLIGAVIEGGPEGPLYLRITGPEALLSRQLDAVDAMFRSVAIAE